MRRRQDTRPRRAPLKISVERLESRRLMSAETAGPSSTRGRWPSTDRSTPCSRPAPTPTRSPGPGPSPHDGRRPWAWSPVHRPPAARRLCRPPRLGRVAGARAGHPSPVRRRPPPLGPHRRADGPDTRPGIEAHRVRIGHDNEPPNRASPYPARGRPGPALGRHRRYDRRHPAQSRPRRHRGDVYHHPPTAAGQHDVQSRHR